VDPAAWLSADECDRAGRFVFERDRRRFIVGRARLRQLVALRLGIRPEAVEFAYGPRGKPRLSSRFASADLRFNVSHSAGLAVYAFARGREVGIDVEAVRALPGADQVAARFFSRRENEAYRALDAGDRPLGFFNCWTRKEAFIKALGDGLHCPLDSFEVSLVPGAAPEILSVAGVAGLDCGWTLCEPGIDLGPGFAAAVAVAEPMHGQTSRPVTQGASRPT
jgi:4'-phosphopantetheinyl transferase